MAEYQFNPCRWVQRLTEALDWFVDYESSWEERLVELSFVERRELGWPVPQHKGPTKERVDRYPYIYDYPRPALLSEYERTLLPHLSDTMAVLRQHPVIDLALAHEDGRTEIGVSIPYRRDSVDIVLFATELVNHAVEHSADETASLLEDTISRGEQIQLDGYFIALFHGLRIAEDHELPNGMTLTSFERVQRFIDLRFFRKLFLRKGFSSRDFSSVGAVVKRYQWGPPIVPFIENELPIRWASHQDADDTELILSMLPVVCDAPITSFQSFPDCIDRSTAKVIGMGWFRPTLRELEGELSSLLGRSSQVPTLSGKAALRVGEVFSSLRRLSEDYGQDVSTGLITQYDLIDMSRRFNGYLLKREPLPSLANFYLTMLESGSLRDRRRNAAQRYGIDFEILDKVGNLAANRGGGLFARKASGKASTLTGKESKFLRETCRVMILRATEVSYAPNGRHSRIAMSDLPSPD